MKTAAIREKLEIGCAQQSLQNFTEYTFPQYQSNWHHIALCEKLDAFARGEIRRLMVTMPPRHGKSELVSRRLPAFIFGLNPTAQIIACSHNQELARSMNRSVQRIMSDKTYAKVFPKTFLSGRNVRDMSEGNWLRNTDEFEIVGHGGYYKCAGIGGGITGRGFNFGIIDDPVKNAEEANSETIRNKMWEWYTSTFYTRQEHKASILLTLTRWHEDDLGGRLLDRMKDGGDQWEIVNYPAVLEEETEGDPREVGDALWPDKYDEEDLEKIQKAVGPKDWQGLFQQNPTPVGGDIIKDHWFEYYYTDGDNLVLPTGQELNWKNLARFVMVDLATSKKTHSDYMVVGAFGGGPNGELFTLDIRRERVEGPDIIPMITGMLKKWRVGIVYIESTGFQLSIVQNARKKGLPARELSRDSDKISRAYAATPLMEDGKFYLPVSTPWLPLLEAELKGFPNAAHDDQVDVVVDACNYWQSRMGIVHSPVDDSALTERDRERQKLLDDLKPNHGKW